MAVNGTRNVSVSALEESETTSVANQRKISLASSGTFPAGTKVAVISGTCGTTAVKVDLLSPGYTANDGTEVTFTSEGTIEGIAFSATPNATMAVLTTSGDGIFATGRTLKLCSASDKIAVTDIPGSGGTLGGLSVNVFTDNVSVTTASYTVMIWGS